MKILIIITLFLIGCQTGYVYSRVNYAGDGIELGVGIYGFGEADKVEIVKAIDQWNYALNGNLILVIGNDIKIIKISGEQKSHWKDKTLYLNRDNVNNKDIYYIMIHEFGHLFGANGTIMNECSDWRNYQCIDYLSMVGVSDHLGIDISKLNYCNN